MSIKTNKVFFENLDSIRFIAATMVFLGHGLSQSYKLIPSSTVRNLLDLISSGATGVSIFFVLSGFLITYLLISEYELNLKIEIKKFYMRRILRIWPLYFAVVIISFIIYPFAKSIGIGERILYNVSFLSNFVKCFYVGVLMPEGVTWSVAVEEQFYLFWPLIFTFLPTKYWIHLILLTILGSLLFRILYYNDNVILYFHSFSVLLDLGIGGLFAYFIKTKNQFRTFFENSTTISHLIYFFISFCLLYWSVKIFDFKYGFAISRVFNSTSFAFIICAQAMTKSKSILNLKNWKFASKWGKCTYGIYLIHPIALTVIRAIAEHLHFSDLSIVNACIIALSGFMLTLLLSKLSYVYFEMKFLKLKDKYSMITSHN